MNTNRTFILGAVLGGGLATGLAFVSMPLEKKFETTPPSRDTKTVDGPDRGCLIQEPPSGEDLMIIFYGSVGRITIDLPKLSLDRVVSYKWLGGNRALYLELLITVHDSGPSTLPADIVYDFVRGQIYVASDITLWRSWTVDREGSALENWMTKQELDTVVERLEAKQTSAEPVVAPNRSLPPSHGSTLPVRGSED